MLKLGKAARLDEDNLPTNLQVFSHYLYLRIEKIQSGEWSPNVTLAEVAKAVASDVAAQWPHTLHGKDGVRKVTMLLEKYKAMNKLPVGRRGIGFGQEFDTLFDVAVCSHKDNCTCHPESKVPPRQFCASIVPIDGRFDSLSG